MTLFEELAVELGVGIELDGNGFYTGKTKALALILNDIILSDDESIYSLPLEEQLELARDRFYKMFPYMAPAQGRRRRRSKIRWTMLHRHGILWIKGG